MRLSCRRLPATGTRAGPAFPVRHCALRNRQFDALHMWGRWSAVPPSSRSLSSPHHHSISHHGFPVAASAVLAPAVKTRSTEWPHRHARDTGLRRFGQNDASDTNLHKTCQRASCGSRALRIWLSAESGEMPEWSNGAVSKTVVGATPPRVRIPLSPPSSRCELRTARLKRRISPKFQRGLLEPPEPRRLALRLISVSERLSSLTERTSTKSVRLREN